MNKDLLIDYDYTVMIDHLKFATVLFDGQKHDGNIV
jgi:hypothetical protein